MLNNIVQLVGAVGVVLSLLLVARQTKRLGDQIRTGNVVGRYQLLKEAGDRYHTVLNLLYNSPELRPYFYDRLPCSQGDPNRAKALILAEMLADALNHAISVVQRFPAISHPSGWHTIATFYTQQPLMREVLGDLPYFPHLAKLDTTSPDNTGGRVAHG